MVNAPHSFGHLNAWSPVGSTVWKGLGGVALLEKVCYWRRALKVQRLMPFPVCMLFRMLVLRFLLLPQASVQIINAQLEPWLRFTVEPNDPDSCVSILE